MNKLTKEEIFTKLGDKVNEELMHITLAAIKGEDCIECKLVYVGAMHNEVQMLLRENKLKKANKLLDLSKEDFMGNLKKANPLNKTTTDTVDKTADALEVISNLLNKIKEARA